MLDIPHHVVPGISHSTAGKRRQLGKMGGSDLAAAVRATTPAGRATMVVVVSSPRMMVT